MEELRGEAVLALGFTAVLVVGVLALTVHAYRRTFEAYGTDRRILALAQALGGAAVGPEQWLCPWGRWHAGLLAVRGRPGLSRASIWLSRRPANPPRLVLRVVHEYHEPLREAFKAGQAGRVVVRPPRPSLSSAEPSTPADRVRVVAASDESARALLDRRELRAHVHAALAVGFPELIIYPGAGVELVVPNPRPGVFDAAFVRAALSRLEPIAASIS